LEGIIGIVFALPLGVWIGYTWRDRISKQRRARALAEHEQQERYRRAQERTRQAEERDRQAQQRETRKPRPKTRDKAQG
jgi:hypothetical protein